MDHWAQWGIGLAIAFLGAVNTNLMWEIRQLRAWRHKIGDDPCHALSRLYDMHDERLTRLERKIFNGAHS